MKLSHNFSQFEKKNVLLIATGKQDAVFYHSKEGEVNKVLSFQIPKPKYSDNEGIFQKSMHGRMQSGSVEISNDAPIVRDFLHELTKRAKTIKADFSEIYIFAPKNTKNKISDALPYEWRQKINQIMEGNYYNKPATFLLEKIAEQDEKAFHAHSNEEKKILAHATQARRVLKSSEH